MELDTFEQDIEAHFELLEPILDMEVQMRDIEKTASLYSKRRKPIILRVHEI